MSEYQDLKAKDPQKGEAFVVVMKISFKVELMLRHQAQLHADTIVSYLTRLQDLLFIGGKNR